jgi:hypothetical protein
MTGDGLDIAATDNNQIMFLGTWQYVEIKVTPGAAGKGHITIKVDGGSRDGHARPSRRAPRCSTTSSPWA